jgi:hypothetical protein
LNPEDANAVLREAAEIFESIGMAESAAQCFSDLGDYERAGMNFSFGIYALCHFILENIRMSF